MATNKKSTSDASNRTRSTTKRATKPIVRTDDVLTSTEIQVKAIVSNISMLYNTIRELKERENYQQIERLNVAQEENFAKLSAIDPELGEKMIKKYRTNERGILASRTKHSSNGYSSTQDIEDINQTDLFLDLFNRTTQEDEEEEEYGLYKDNGENQVETVKVETFEDFTNTDEVYDVLDLPSKGQCYPHKKSKIAVSFLTATDENFITSPNLYRDGLIIDCLLHRKVVDKTFDVDNLCSGDVDAITFFLRVSSYGAEFPATFTDPDTNQSFETVIDLNQIKLKPFNLVGDENGWFDFELPVSKDRVKFKFLTKKDERKLEKLNALGTNQARAIELKSIVSYLDTFLNDESEKLEQDYVYQIEDGMEAINKIAEDLEAKDGLPINKLITNRMEMSIMSVNGNTDRQFIKKYVRNMVARDSIEFRRYVIENTPGLDFSIKIEKPESLGGGLIDTFLEWSDTVFLSIT